jgi:hypothetical protein
MRYALLIYADQASWADLSDVEKARLRSEEMPGWVALFEELAGIARDPAHPPVARGSMA